MGLYTNIFKVIIFKHFLNPISFITARRMTVWLIWKQKASVVPPQVHSSQFWFFCSLKNSCERLRNFFMFYISESQRVTFSISQFLKCFDEIFRWAQNHKLEEVVITNKENFITTLLHIKAKGTVSNYSLRILY